MRADKIPSNAKSTLNRTPVGSESFGGLPKEKTRALEALETRICELFAAGQNTMQIAEAVNAKEHQVYNILARLNA